MQDENNPVIGASSESVPGAAGETTHALESYGVSSIVLADGPGGVRITQQFEATDLESGEKRQVYHYCTAWPVGTLLAQSFDPEILEQVGCGMAADMQAMRIDLLLGPGMNIQRDPMCGRNFLKILSYLERWRQQWYAVFRACQEEVDALSIMQLIIRRRIGMLWIL